MKKFFGLLIVLSIGSFSIAMEVETLVTHDYGVTAEISALRRLELVVRCLDGNLPNDISRLLGRPCMVTQPVSLFLRYNLCPTFRKSCDLKKLDQLPPLLQCFRVAALAYRLDPAFRRSVDSSVSALESFVEEVKQDRGNSRPNAVIHLPVGVGVSLCRAYTGSLWPGHVGNVRRNAPHDPAREEMVVMRNRENPAQVNPQARADVAVAPARDFPNVQAWARAFFLQKSRENSPQEHPHFREILKGAEEAMDRVAQEVKTVCEKVENSQERARIMADMGKAAALETMKNPENLVQPNQQVREQLEKYCANARSNAIIYNGYGRFVDVALTDFALSYIETVLDRENYLTKAPSRQSINEPDDIWEQMINWSNTSGPVQEVEGLDLDEVEWSEELFDKFMRNISASQAILLIGLYEVQKLRKLVSLRIKNNRTIVNDKGEPLALDPKKIVMDLSKCPRLVRHFNALPVAVKKALSHLVAV